MKNLEEKKQEQNHTLFGNCKSISKMKLLHFMFIHVIWWVGYDVFYISVEKTKHLKAPELHDVMIHYCYFIMNLRQLVTLHIPIGEKPC